MSKATHAQLTSGSIIASLLKLSVPIILANILQTAYQLTDAFWVGRLGGNAVAAVSVSFPIMFVLVAAGAGLGVAGSTLVAQYFGANQKQMVNHIASQTLLMVAVTSGLISVAGWFFAPYVLSFMGITPEVLIEAVKFLRISSIGIAFVFSFAMFQSIMRGIGEVKLPLFIVLGTVLLNFILDPLFIFGWKSVPAFGVAGAALATIGTQSIAMLVGLATLFSGRYQIHLTLKNFAPDWSVIKRAFLLGFPASIEQSVRGLGLTVMAFLVSSFGTITVAAYGVGANIIQFVLIPAMGLSMATATLVGQNIGAGKTERAQNIARLSATASFITLSLFGLIIFLFAPFFVRFFIANDAAVITTAVTFVRTIALSFGFFGLQLSLIGVFRAAGNMLTTMVLALLSQWVFQFPTAYLLSQHTNLHAAGLWWAFPVSNVATALITIIWFRKGDWKKGRLTQTDQLAHQVTSEIITEEGVRS